MKIAIPANENKTLCPHFGHAPFFAIIDLYQETKEVNTIELIAPSMGGHEAVPPWLKSLGVTLMIAGGIGQKAIDFVAANGITLIAGVPELPITEVVNLWLNDKLVSQFTPCNHTHEEGCTR